MSVSRFQDEHSPAHSAPDCEVVVHKQPAAAFHKLRRLSEAIKATTREARPPFIHKVEDGGGAVNTTGDVDRLSRAD